MLQVKSELDREKSSPMGHPISVGNRVFNPHSHKVGPSELNKWTAESLACSSAERPAGEYHC